MNLTYLCYGPPKVRRVCRCRKCFRWTSL